MPYPMRRYYRGGIRRGRRPGRYVWEAFKDDDNAVSPSGNATVDLTLSGFLADPGLEPTLVRIRGVWGVAFDSYNSISAAYHKSVFAHLGIWFEPAAAVTSVTAGFLAYEGCLWHDQGGQTRDFNFLNQTTNTTIMAFQAGNDFHRTFDIKAKRKFRNEVNRLTFVMTNSGLSTAQIVYQIRVLWRVNA